MCSVLAPGSIVIDSGIGRLGNGPTSECGWQGLGGEPKPREENGFQQLATDAETTDSLVEQSLEGARCKRETSSEEDPCNRCGQGRRRGNTDSETSPTLRSASPRRSSFRAASWDPFSSSDEDAWWPCVTGKASRRTSRSQGRAPSDCSNADADDLQRDQRIAQWSGNRLHSAGGSAEAQSTPCVSVSTLVRAQCHKSEGATSMIRTESGQTLQTVQGSRDQAIQAGERVKEWNEPRHLCSGRAIGYGAIDEETRRWVGAKWLQRVSGEDPTSNGDGPAARWSMSGSTSAMKQGADVRMVTVSSDVA